MNKKIDDIFQEKFSNFEAKPETDLWSKIQHDEQWTRHLRRQSVRNIIIYTVLGALAISTSIILINNRINRNVEVIDEAIEEQGKTENTMIVSDKGPAQNITEEPKTEKVEVNEATENLAEAVSTETLPTQEIHLEEATAPHTETATVNPTVPVKTETTTSSTTKTTKENADSKAVEKSVSHQNAETAIRANAVTPPSKPTTSPFSIPNAFTPNGDGLNDVFAPVTNSEIQSYQLDIYARNGQKLFTSRDLQYGWNGEYQGGMMEGGSYIYFIKYKDADGQEHIDKGQLLLIR